MPRLLKRILAEFWQKVKQPTNPPAPDGVSSVTAISLIRQITLDATPSRLSRDGLRLVRRCDDDDR